MCVPPQPASIYSAEFSCLFSVRVKAVSLLPAVSGQREHVSAARHNSRVLYPFWGKIIIGKVHCNVRIVLVIAMSEDISNTDHSTWELLFGSSLITCYPAVRCLMLTLFTAHMLSGTASPATTRSSCSLGRLPVLCEYTK